PGAVHRPPPPPPHPGGRLPVQGLPPGVQPVHRHGLAGDPPHPRADPAAPAGGRQGGVDGATGPRASGQPPAPAGAAPPGPGPRPTRRAGRCRTPTSRGTRCTRRWGKKGVPPRDPADPPRRRAAVIRGPGTWANDRPPVLGVVGRTSGRLRLRVVAAATAAQA